MASRSNTEDGLRHEILSDGSGDALAVYSVNADGTQASAGGGGGGGGAATIADGADVTQGALADAIVAAGATGSIAAKLRRATQGLEDLKTLLVLAAGSHIIGQVGIDQTAPGTTNAVQANAGTNLNTSALALETGGNLAALAGVEGAAADAIVAAGAAGSASAKLRRVTQGLEDLKTLLVLGAGSHIIGQVGLDQTTPGTTNATAAHTNAYRSAGVAHRAAVIAKDKLAQVGTITLSAVASSTALTNTAYWCTAIAGNRWGVAQTATIQTITPTATNLIRAAFAAVTGADYYDIFMSTSSTGPLWVGRITETQRGTGIVLTAVGTTGAGGTAGAVDIQVVGTGLASNVVPFTNNNAYTPVIGGVSAVNCAGYSLAHLHVEMKPTDLRSLPTLVLIPFFQDQTSTSDWFQGNLISVNLLTGLGQSLEQDFQLPVDGATDMMILVDTITGQLTGGNVGAYIWVELA